jgi:hypothetical protein
MIYSKDNFISNCFKRPQSNFGIREKSGEALFLGMILSDGKRFCGFPPQKEVGF